MAKVTLHLRSETKPLEHRSALSPTVVRKLIENGFAINVERSPVRIFDDSEFEDAGATLAKAGSWPDAPHDHIIIGLKELLEEKFPLVHTHVMFAHCYKNQGGWQDVLSRFPRGGGTLYDLEFLQDSTGRRIAAFGYHAGYAGAALALEDWAWQIENPNKPFPGKTFYHFKSDLDTEVQTQVSRAAATTHNNGKLPRVLVIGALGRCGRGSLDMCRKAGIPESNLIKWDMAETNAKPGPYPEIREADIFINCIYLDADIPPFINEQFLHQQGDDGKEKRNLSVVCDVSCDTTNSRNPVPIADVPTYFDKPTTTLSGFSNPPLSVIAIDHLPSLLPREASEAFSEALLPSLLQLSERDTAPVWVEAEKLFKKKCSLLP